MIALPRRRFRHGLGAFYPEEAPVRRVRVDPFRIDATPVTNAQFAAFVAATGYVTFAEIAPDPKRLSRHATRARRAGKPGVPQ